MNKTPLPLRLIPLLSAFGSLLLAACGSIVVEMAPTTTVSEITASTATAVALPTGTASLTVVASPTASPTLVPTETIPASPTASPTTSPTATPLPWGTLPISTTNVSQVSQVYVWGRGTAEQVWSADSGRLILVLTPFGLDIYQAESLELLASLQDVQQVAVSEDTSLAVMAYPAGVVEVWDMAALQRQYQFTHQLDKPKYPPPGYDENQQLAIHSMALSPNRDLLAIGFGDGVIDLYQLEAGELRASMFLHYTPFPAKLLFTPDQRYLLSFNQGQFLGKFTRIDVGLWAVDSGEIANFISDVGRISDHPFSPDGSVLVSSKWGGFLLRHSLPDGQFLGTVPTGLYFPSVDYATDGMHLLVDGGQQVRRISDGAMVKLDGETLASITPPSAAWLASLTEEQKWTLGHPPYLFAIRFGQQHSLYAWGQSGSVTYRWDLASGETQAFTWEREPQGVSVSYDQGALATCLRDALLVMDLADGQVRSFGPCEPGYADFSPIDDLIAKSYLQRVHILRLPDGELVHHLRGHSLTPQIVRYGPDGRYLVSSHSSGGQWETILWRTEPAAMVRRIDNEEWALEDLALSPDADYLVTAGDKLRIWRMSDGWQVKILDLGVSRLAFSPSGDLVAAGDWRGNIHLVSIPSGEVLTVLAGHRGLILDLRFSPDGVSLVSASRDGTVRLWGVGVLE